MLNDYPVASKQSDIFGLGCIFHELASGERAFSCDWAVMEYMFSKRRPANLDTENLIDRRCKVYLSQMIYAMIDLSWQRRPSTRDILKGLEFLTGSSLTSINAIQSVQGLIRDSARRHDAVSDGKAGRRIEFRSHWYVSSVSSNDT